ncbi:MAG TPA: hypothetical protein VJP40_03005 [bacterium]|nr:hypothetical protein [bacterium]
MSWGRVLRAWHWLALCALLGCSGAATAPAPLAEIPSVINIPQDVSVDVSKISGNSDSAAIKLQTLTPQELLGIIRLGPETVEAVNEEILAGLLSPFTNIDIPVSPQVVNFEGSFLESDGAILTFKFDFSDFDFDGDGAKDGFTGCTCPVGCTVTSCPSQAPLSDLKRVGYRIWIKGELDTSFTPILAGFFDRLPVKDDPASPVDEENPGKGQFRVGSVEQGMDESGTEITESLLIGVIYDHKDPVEELNKSTQAFLVNDFVDSAGTVLRSNRSNSFVAQLAKTDPGGIGYLEKTVKSTFEAFVAAGFESPEDAREFQLYVGRFREDADFWSGSATLENPDQSLSLPTTCARISTATEVDPGICQDLAIDTTGEAFLRGALDSDVLFPADFPPTPPF